MLLARNGLFVQMKTPWLDCTTRVAEVGMHLPYGVGGRGHHVRLRRHSLGIAGAVHRRRAQAMPNEAAGALIYDARSGALRLAMHEAIEVGPGHVRYRIEELAADELVAIDLHSHGRLGAFWSGEDDRDDQGVRVCGVFGNLDRERPTARFRLALNGLFRELPHPWAVEPDGALPA
jgi:PRTRC genetic system protein A